MLEKELGPVNEIMEENDDSDAAGPSVQSVTQIFIPYDAVADSGVVSYEACTHNWLSQHYN